MRGGPWRAKGGILSDASFPGDKEFQSGITTRSLGDIKKRPDWRPVGAWAVVKARQVHGRRIVWTDGPISPEPEADGFFTRQPGLALGVFVADCVPVWVAWPARGVCGVLHVGWRGLASGIVREAARDLRRRFGGPPWRGLRVAAGPHIRSCCYEVGSEVARRFRPPSVSRQGAAWRLELAREIRRQWVASGLPASGWSEAGHCTRDDRRLFSHRRDADGRRMLAYIFRKET